MTLFEELMKPPGADLKSDWQGFKTTADAALARTRLLQDTNLFFRFDEDRNHELSKEELTRALQAPVDPNLRFGLKMLSDNFDQIKGMSSKNSNATGIRDADINLLTTIATGRTRAEQAHQSVQKLAVQLFPALDANGDGRLTIREARDVHGAGELSEHLEHMQNQRNFFSLDKAGFTLSDINRFDGQKLSQPNTFAHLSHKLMPDNGELAKRALTQALIGGGIGYVFGSWRMALVNGVFAVGVGSAMNYWADKRLVTSRMNQLESGVLSTWTEKLGTMK